MLATMHIQYMHMEFALTQTAICNLTPLLYIIYVYCEIATVNGVSGLTHDHMKVQPIYATDNETNSKLKQCILVIYSIGTLGVSRTGMLFYTS